MLEMALRRSASMFGTLADSGKPKIIPGAGAGAAIGCSRRRRTLKAGADLRSGQGGAGLAGFVPAATAVCAEEFGVVVALGAADQAAGVGVEAAGGAGARTAGGGICLGGFFVLALGLDRKSVV